MSKILGIDLGTTNCCVAVVEGTTPQVICNREGSRTTPSIVGFTEDNERLVGQIAKRQAITNPMNTVFAVKRLVGRKFDSEETRHAREVLPYEIVRAGNGDIKIRARGKDYSPEEISAFILREIKEFSEESLGEEITEAIITVPAYFDDAQRQATRDAGRIAGLEVLRIFNEPTAASLAYGLDRKGSEVVAVYDLGGGTFDISILELGDGIYEVKATAGDTYLGGEDFDKKIMDWLLSDFERATGIDLRQDRMALQRLKEAAEKAKCELSTAMEATITLPFISADSSGPKHINRTLSRSRFESLVADLIDRTAAPCLDALKAAGLKASDVDQVIVVGGQTRTPRVQQIVAELFGREPNREINPDEVVAIGAAIQGGVLKGEIKDVVLLDVTPLSLGIETHGGVFEKLIERNSTIPTKNTKVFTTVGDNQSVVEIHVVQGEREVAGENKSLGRFELVGIPAAPRGVPQIEVSFAIDSNGIVNVSARDLATGKAQGIQINPAGGLSQAEIDRIINEASSFAEADRQRRELSQIRNRLEGMLASNERVFAEFITAFAPDERERIEETLKRSRDIAAADSREALKEAIFDMQGVSKLLTRVMLQRSAAKGPAAQASRDVREGPGSKVQGPKSELEHREKHVQTRLLRGARRRPQRRERRAQVRLPQARSPASPGSQPGKRRGRGEIQGGLRGLRRPLRPGQARALRPVRPFRDWARRAPASARPSIRRSSASSPGSSRTSSASAAGSDQQARPVPAGSDVVYRMEVSFRDAAFGVEAPLVISRLEPCEACSGSGAEPGSSSPNLPLLRRARAPALLPGLPDRHAPLLHVRRGGEDRG